MRAFKFLGKHKSDKKMFKYMNLRILNVAAFNVGSLTVPLVTYRMQRKNKLFAINRWSKRTRLKKWCICGLWFKSRRSGWAMRLENCKLYCRVVYKLLFLLVSHWLSNDIKSRPSLFCILIHQNFEPSSHFLDFLIH